MANGSTISFVGKLSPADKLRGSDVVEQEFSFDRGGMVAELGHTTVEELEEEYQTDPELRAAYHRALRERDRAKNKTAAVVEAVREAVLLAAQEIKVNPPAAIRPAPRTGGAPEVAVIHASDWQLGKETPSYNSDVCEERVRQFGQKVIKLAQVQHSDHPVTEARLYLTGDMIEGEGIFPTQPHVVDSGIYRQVVRGQRLLCNLILDLLTWFDRIHVVGVIGNHGSIRLGMNAADPESNMDRLLYKTTERILLGPEGHPSELAKSGRLSFDIPDGAGERNWYAVDYVGDWGFLLAHGDQIRGGFAGFPFYGLSKKANGWIDAIDSPWDYLLFGHWHTPTSVTVGKRQARCNGSTESDNSYAQEQLGAVGHPTQYLAFVHPKHGMTAEYWVSLEDKEPSRRRARRWSA